MTVRTFLDIAQYEGVKRADSLSVCRFACVGLSVRGLVGLSVRQLSVDQFFGSSNCRLFRWLLVG